MAGDTRQRAEQLWAALVRAPVGTREDLIEAALTRERAEAVAECIAAVDAERSSGENSDPWTITRDMAFHKAMDAIRARATPSG